jgi:hypothetical protein
VYNPSADNITALTGGTARLSIGTTAMNVLNTSLLINVANSSNIKTDDIWITTSGVPPAETASPPVATRYLGTDTQFLMTPDKWFAIKDETGTIYLVPGYVKP